MDCVDLDALEAEARRVMSPPAWVFCDTGADDEIIAKENVSAWRKLRLRPRVLRDIVKIDTSVTLLGQRVAAPIVVAPTGRHHPTRCRPSHRADNPDITPALPRAVSDAGHPSGHVSRILVTRTGTNQT